VTEASTVVVVAPTKAPPAVAEHEEVTPAESESGRSSDEALVEADLLIEDVSIDGMCGVY
jgi:mycofactocin precursor